MKFFALIAAVSATQYDNMNEDELLSQLSSKSLLKNKKRSKITKI
jgi:hypothetical protein